MTERKRQQGKGSRVKRGKGEEYCERGAGEGAEGEGEIMVGEP